MQSLINILLAIGLAVSAWANIKQHNEIVGAYGETYAVYTETGWGLFFLDRRLRELEDSTCYQFLTPTETRP